MIPCDLPPFLLVRTSLCSGCWVVLVFVVDVDSFGVVRV